MTVTGNQSPYFYLSPHPAEESECESDWVGVRQLTKVNPPRTGMWHIPLSMEGEAQEKVS